MEKLIFFDVEQKWKLFLSLAPSLLSSRRMVLNTDGCECNKLTQSSRKSSIKGEVFTALKFLKELYDVNLIEAEHLKRLFFWSFRHHFFIMLWKRKFSLEQWVYANIAYISHDIQDTVECHQIPLNVINLGLILSFHHDADEKFNFQKKNAIKKFTPIFMKAKTPPWTQLIFHLIFYYRQLCKKNLCVILSH